jgi:hypothetical protein
VKRIGIALVAPDMMHTQTALNLTSMVGYQIGAHRDSITTTWRSGSVLSELRQKAAKELIEAGADWILFVDSDMGFPMDALQRLLEHDLDVVAANCSKRQRPIGVTAKVTNPATGILEPVWPAELGLEKVDAVGTAFMLIKAEVFTKIGWPWFMQPWIEEKEDWVGEDVFFCRRCYEAGIPIYIDHELSWQVNHYGTYGYSMKDVLAERQMVESGAWEGKR